jgi:CBS domain-containing protein
MINYKSMTNDTARALSTLRRSREQGALLKGTEAFPYSEELRSVMVSPVLTCSPSDPVMDAVGKMARAGVSCIVAIENTTPSGILTERDILKRIASERCLIPGQPVSSFMTPEPITLSPGDSIYRALSVLSLKGIKHLPLVEGGKVAGIVTMRQLLKLRYPEPIMFIERIAEARDAAALKDVRADLPELAATKLNAGISAYDVVTMLSLINQDIHRRAFELILRKLGKPPAPCCLFLTGSHGRLENLLSTDQDHGLIIADSPDGQTQYSEYYMELTESFSTCLSDIGYPTCPGYVMSMNPTWRKSLSEWKQQIRYWLDAQVLNLARFLTVLFDSTPIYGKKAMFEEMMDFAFTELGKHHEALRVLHDEVGKHKAPLGVFGRFIVDKSDSHWGQLDVKKSGLQMLVEAVRILSLLHRIRETSTLNRIHALVEGGFIHPDEGEYFEASLKELIRFALNGQVEKHMKGREINTYINPKRLSPREKNILRHSFKSVSLLQDLTAAEFGELFT